MGRFQMLFKKVSLGIFISSLVFSGTAYSAASDVSILGSWIKGTTHTKEAGTNRALVVMVYGEGSGDISASGVTYGGQAMTKVVEKSFLSGAYSYTGAFILNEAKVAAASSSTISVTWSKAPGTGSAVVSVFLSNVNQASLLGTTMVAGLVGTTITTGSAPTHAAGDMILLAGTAATNGTYTINNGFIRGIPETSASFGDITSAYKIGTGGVELPSISHSASQRQTMVAFVVKVASLIQNKLPIVSINAPVNGALFAPPANVSVNVGATDLDGSISKIELRNNGVLAGTSVNQTSSDFTLSNLGSGTYTLEAKAYDNLNATETATITIRVQESIPWQETFTLANGVKSDGAPTSWTATRTSGTFAINGNRLAVNGAGSQGVLTTGVMNIANKPVVVSLDLVSQGKLEANQDYVKLFKKVDGGPEVLIGEKWGNQAATTLSQQNITGTTLQLVIRTYVSASDEYYFLDNLSATQSGNAWRSMGAPIAKPAISGVGICVANGFTYISAADPVVNGRLTVYMFNGTTWEPVGARGVSANEVRGSGVAQENGEVYVAYIETDNKGYVKKFNGTSWDAVGTTSFTDAGWSVYDFEVGNGNAAVSYSVEVNASEQNGCYPEYGYGIAIAFYNGMTWNKIRERCIPDEFTPLQLSFANGILYAENHGFDLVGDGGLTVDAWNGTSWYYVTGRSMEYESSPWAVVLEGNKIYSVSNRNGYQIFDGQSWSTVGPLNFLPDSRTYTTMTVTNGKPYVAFARLGQVSVMTFDGQNWGYVGNQNFSSNDFYDIGKIVVNGTTPTVMFATRQGVDISAMNFSDGSVGWQALSGSLLKSENSAADMITVNGVIYLAGVDAGNNNRLSVHKYNGTAWESVGTRGFSANAVTGVKMTQENGVIYVAYLESDAKGYVRKFDGTSWQVVGSTWFTDYGSTVFDLEVNKGIPHVSFNIITDPQQDDCYYGTKTAVAKLNGAVWETISDYCTGKFNSEKQLSFANGVLFAENHEYYYESIVWLNFWDGSAWNEVTTKQITTERTPWSLTMEGNKIYEAYVENATNALNCQMFDGQTWKFNGPENFLAGPVTNLSSAVLNGKQYIAFDRYEIPWEKPGLVSVMAFNGVTWEFLGSQDFADGPVSKMVLNGPSPYVLLSSSGPEVKILKFK